jgi:YVTN family beta-propeller protein/autotransporter-associated beta strand protein
MAALCAAPASGQVTSRAFIAVDDTTDKLWIADTADRSVSSITVSGDPATVGVSPDGRKAYVTNQSTNSVSVIDVATSTLTGLTATVGTSPRGIAVSADGSTLYIANYLPFNGGSLRLTAPWTTTRHVSLLAGGGIIDTNGFDATIDGDIINSGVLTKSGAGRLEIAGAASHAGGTLVDGGSLVVTGQHLGPITLPSGAKLAGTGTVGAVTAAQPAVEPGDGGTGTLSATQLTMSPGAALAVELLGANTWEYDRLVVSGTASIDGAQLAVTTGTWPAVGTAFTILTNATGTLAGLPEGAIFEANNRVLHITYAGGDGNDVVITMAAPPAITDLDVSDRTIPEDGTLEPINFTVSDDFTSAEALNVMITSSNQALLPDSRLTLTSNGTSRSLIAAPLADQFGQTQITIVASDGVLHTLACSR